MNSLSEYQTPESINNSPPPKPPDKETESQIPKMQTHQSYKQKLLHTSPHIYFPTWLARFEDPDEQSMEEDEVEETPYPKVKIPKNLLDKGREPWRKALILYTDSIKISAQNLENHLRRIWKIQEKIRITDLGASYYILRFNNSEDYFFALAGGPWFLFNKYLFIQQWTPNFRPDTAKRDKMVIWIQLPQLPVEYYSPEILLHVIQEIGRPIKVDLHTSQSERNKYARVCVEVVVSTPLPPALNLYNYNQPIHYEIKSLFCNKCGIIGHLPPNCSQNPHTYPIPSFQQETHQPNERSSQNKEIQKEKTHETPWTIITSRPNRKKYIEPNNKKSDQQEQIQTKSVSHSNNRDSINNNKGKQQLYWKQKKVGNNEGKKSDLLNKSNNFSVLQVEDEETDYQIMEVDANSIDQITGNRPNPLSNATGEEILSLSTKKKQYLSDQSHVEENKFLPCTSSVPGQAQSTILPMTLENKLLSYPSGKNPNTQTKHVESDTYHIKRRQSNKPKGATSTLSLENRTLNDTNPSHDTLFIPDDSISKTHFTSSFSPPLQCLFHHGPITFTFKQPRNSRTTKHKSFTYSEPQNQPAISSVRIESIEDDASSTNYAKSQENLRTPSQSNPIVPFEFDAKSHGTQPTTGEFRKWQKGNHFPSINCGQSDPTNNDTGRQRAPSPFVQHYPVYLRKPTLLPKNQVGSRTGTRAICKDKGDSIPKDDGTPRKRGTSPPSHTASAKRQCNGDRSHSKWLLTLALPSTGCSNEVNDVEL